MILTQDQFDIMFLITTGIWNTPPLSPVSGVYLGHPVSIDPARWTTLKTRVIATEMAVRALAQATADNKEIGPTKVTRMR